MRHAAHRLVVALGLLGCSEEPLDFSRLGEDLGVGAGGTATSLPDSGAPGVGGVVGLDPFVTDVLPRLEQSCGQPFCHGRPPMADARLQLEFPVAALSPEAIEANRAEVLLQSDRAFPTNSPILRWPQSQSDGLPPHPTPTPLWTTASADYLAVLAWISSDTPVPPGADAEVPVAPSEAPTTGEGVPCSALPQPGRTPFDFAAFELRVNPVLVASCAAGCHGIAGLGGGLWLRPTADDCEVQWNFLAAQWFVDVRQPRASLLLTKPLDPNHAGRAIFPNAADPGYLAVSRWIEESLAR
ncbi:MAG: hypothetical protein ACOYM9_03315 [Bradymonadia bacterium]